MEQSLLNMDFLEQNEGEGKVPEGTPLCPPPKQDTRKYTSFTQRPYFGGAIRKDLYALIQIGLMVAVIFLARLTAENYTTVFQQHASPASSVVYLVCYNIVLIISFIKLGLLMSKYPLVRFVGSTTITQEERNAWRMMEMKPSPYYFECDEMDAKLQLIKKMTTEMSQLTEFKRLCELIEKQKNTENKPNPKSSASAPLLSHSSTIE